MGEVAITVAKWALKLSFFTSVILAVMVIIGVTTSYLVAGFNSSVLGDVFAIIQIWLPFNLNVLLIWLVVSSGAYIAYRLSILGYNLFNSFIGS